MKKVAIEQLIPQRSPILMVDELLQAETGKAITSLTVKGDNCFIDSDGCLAETGLIEHIAQSASAFAGYKAIGTGVDAPPVGYIGEVKKFHCYFRPRLGDQLLTAITIIAEAEGVTLIAGKTCVNDRIAAETQMKIYIKE